MRHFKVLKRDFKNFKTSNLDHQSTNFLAKHSRKQKTRNFKAFSLAKIYIFAKERQKFSTIFYFCPPGQQLDTHWLAIRLIAWFSGGQNVLQNGMV